MQPVSFPDMLYDMRYRLSQYVHALRLDLEAKPNSPSRFLPPISPKIEDPYFGLFNHYFTSKFLDECSPQDINLFLAHSLCTIPRTHTKLWSMARKSERWTHPRLTIISPYLKPVHFHDLFYALQTVEENIVQGKPNHSLDSALERIALLFEIKDLEANRLKFLPNEGPSFHLLSSWAEKGVVHYRFRRMNDLKEMTTPWNLGSEQPPLLSIEETLVHV